MSKSFASEIKSLIDLKEDLRELVERVVHGLMTEVRAEYGAPAIGIYSDECMTVELFNHSIEFPWDELYNEFRVDGGPSGRSIVALPSEEKVANVMKRLIKSKFEF